MKRIGILGGMSPESTIDYYDMIIHQYIDRFGTHHYPEVIIFSVRFGDFIPLMEAGDWIAISQMLGAGAVDLEKAGADFIIIATNTMHKVVDRVQANVRIPILSLLDVLGEEIRTRGYHKVALLGTAYTMEDGFYNRALAKYDIEVVVPDPIDCKYINHVVFDELIAGIISDVSKVRFLDIINGLRLQGVEGLILGCTEIPLLVKENDIDFPLFNTTLIHATAALNYALED